MGKGLRKVIAWLRDHKFDVLEVGAAAAVAAVTGAGSAGVAAAAVRAGVQIRAGHGAAPAAAAVQIRSSPSGLCVDALRLAALLEARGVRVTPAGAPGPTVRGEFDPAERSAVLVLEGVDDAAFEAAPVP